MLQSSQNHDVESRVLVVDYGIGNFASVVTMLRRAGSWGQVASDPSELVGGTHVILPGVGHFDVAAARLRSTGMGETIQELAHGGVSILGICLGMQLLSDGSEEGNLAGLGLIPGTCRRFHPADPRRTRVPHMGWKRVMATDNGKDLFDDLVDGRFYFTHSYHLACTDEHDVAATAAHGETFVAAVRRESIYGTQFHPEKSLRWGMQLLKNFAGTTG